MLAQPQQNSTFALITQVLIGLNAYALLQVPLMRLVQGSYFFDLLIAHHMHTNEWPMGLHHHRCHSEMLCCCWERYGGV